DFFFFLFFFFFNLLSQIRVPVMGRLVAIKQEIKYRSLVKGPYTSPICNALIDPATLSLNGLSLKISEESTSEVEASNFNLSPAAGAKKPVLFLVISTGASAFCGSVIL